MNIIAITNGSKVNAEIMTAPRFRPALRMRPVGSVIPNPWTLVRTYRNRQRMTIAEFIGDQVFTRTIKVSAYRHAVQVQGSK